MMLKNAVKNEVKAFRELWPLFLFLTIFILVVWYCVLVVNYHTMDKLIYLAWGESAPVINWFMVYSGFGRLHIPSAVFAATFLMGCVVAPLTAWFGYLAIFSGLTIYYNYVGLEPEKEPEGE